MSRLSPLLCEFARPLSHAGLGAGALVGRGGHESGSDSSLGSVSAGQTDSGAHPDSFPCGAANHGGPSVAGAPTPVVRALAAGVEDGFDDEPGVLAGIARAFLSVAIVFAMTMGLWTASRSPVPQAGPNPSAVAGAVAFSGPTAQSSPSPNGRYRTKPIGEIQTGERVLAANPQVDHAVVTASEIDPATWRNIRLRMQKPHGGTLDIVLLRPLAWLAEQVDEFEQLAAADSHASVLGHAVGSGHDHAGVQLDSEVGHDSCRIHLALPELGAVGPAEVLAIEPCPPLASGPGRTVTGTFAHAAADVLDLEIEGLDTPLGCTANHRFWSADRQDFVPAGSLTIGEHLRTESGTLRQVTRITPRRGPPVAVFNLEVDAEHVYYVSTAGVLVHNA
ncbi:MAG: polymorphic toxin-type HINT domain-containing protein, partial [Planctomycetaceae bacterium]